MFDGDTMLNVQNDLTAPCGNISPIIHAAVYDSLCLVGEDFSNDPLSYDDDSDEDFFDSDDNDEDDEDDDDDTDDEDRPENNDESPIW